MPIPTRSLSLREPSVGQRKESNIGRPTTSRLNSIRSSVSTSTNTSGGPGSERNKTLKSSSIDTTASSTTDAPSVDKDDAFARRKSLLPQRSMSLRISGRAADGVSLQRQESRLRRPGQAQQIQERPQESSVTARRQITAQAVEAKASTAPPPGTKAVPKLPIPSSPAKTQMTSPKAVSALKTDNLPSNSVAPGTKAVPKLPRPPSPAKTQMTSPKVVSALKTDNIPSNSVAPGSPQRSRMLPPARPTRSASLRQPISSSSVIPAGTRGHVRHRSQVVAPVSGRNEQSAKPDVASSASLARSRPQFSTYQQHFSPKKITKPPTPTTTTSSVSVDHDSFMIPSSRSDVAPLQTELLQLHLFYSSSNQNNIDWKTSSEKKLRKMYNSISESYRSVLAQEQAIQTGLNCLALTNWSENIRQGSSRQDFAEQIQTLSHIVQEVNDVTEPREGRYPKVVRIFEDWMEKSARIKQAREHASTSPVITGDLDFIDPLDRTWREETDVLSARLDLCLRKLQNLDICGEADGDQLGNSALLRIANGHKELLTSMLEELSVIRSIEADIVRSEKLSVTNLVDNLNPVGGSHKTRVGIWTEH